MGDVVVGSVWATPRSAPAVSAPCSWRVSRRDFPCVQSIANAPQVSISEARNGAQRGFSLGERGRRERYKINGAKKGGEILCTNTKKKKTTKTTYRGDGGNSLRTSRVDPHVSLSLSFSFSRVVTSCLHDEVCLSPALTDKRSSPPSLSLSLCAGNNTGLQAVADVAAAIQAGYYDMGIAGWGAGCDPMKWEGGMNPR